jgi:hypothetical protein
LVEDDHDIDCKIDGIGEMKLKSQFVKKAGQRSGYGRDEFLSRCSSSGREAVYPIETVPSPGASRSSRRGTSTCPEPVAVTAS